MVHEILPMLASLQKEIGAINIQYEKLYDRNICIFSFVDEPLLKMEFSLYPFKSIAPKQKEKNGIDIDSLDDIAEGKLMAMLDRFDAKDFFSKKQKIYKNT